MTKSYPTTTPLKNSKVEFSSLYKKKNPATTPPSTPLEMADHYPLEKKLIPGMVIYNIYFVINHIGKVYVKQSIC